MKQSYDQINPYEMHIKQKICGHKTAVCCDSNGFQCFFSVINVFVFCRCYCHYYWTLSAIRLKSTTTFQIYYSIAFCVRLYSSLSLSLDMNKQYNSYHWKNKFKLLIQNLRSKRTNSIDFSCSLLEKKRVRNVNAMPFVCFFYFNQPASVGSLVWYFAVIYDNENFCLLILRVIFFFFLSILLLKCNGRYVNKQDLSKLKWRIFNKCDMIHKSMQQRRCRNEDWTRCKRKECARVANGHCLLRKENCHQKC